MLLAGDIAIGPLLRGRGSNDDTAAGGGVGGKRLSSVVEFAGGTGHIALPLAYLHPDVQFVVLDASPEATRVASLRAAKSGLKNVRVVTSRIDEWNEPFDLAIALHACGELTDMTMDQCLKARAGFVLAPCCIGK